MTTSPPSTPEVVWLGDPRSHDALVVGPKAAHLSRLAGSYPVPPGFCLTAEMYRHAGPDGRLTEDARAAVSQAYASLTERIGVAAPPVAVRSSAVDEDGPMASFAGQHETLLNIAGVEALIDAIQQSWASAQSEQVLAYRRQHGLSAVDIGLAVLVQVLVKSDASGVMFSANPVTGHRDEMVVTASWGLGESIVGGTVTPDMWVVQHNTLEVLEERCGDKRRMTIAVEGGTNDVDVPRFMRGQLSLSRTQVQEVALLGRQLEEENG
jgi:pyruvate, water dikinase